jgi:hypothetical protein
MKDNNTKVQALIKYVDGLKGRLTKTLSPAKKDWVLREINRHENKINFLLGK